MGVQGHCWEGMGVQGALIGRSGRVKQASGRTRRVGHDNGLAAHYPARENSDSTLAQF